MQIIALAIQKGGTGKTITAGALVNAAACKGKKTLAIDLDPQGNLTYMLAADASKGGSDRLFEGARAADLIQHIGGYDIIPASWKLSAIRTGKGSAKRLQEALEPVCGLYDLIIIDTPPTAGELQYNALQAATGVIIPLQADMFSLQSLYQIIGTARQIQGSNPNLEILGYLITQYDQRSTIARQMLDNIRDTAAGLEVPYLGAIRSAVAVKEAAALRRSLFEYAPKSKPAADYMKLFEKIIK